MEQDDTIADAPAKSEDLVPPRWMSRAEKNDFRRLIDARKAVGKPVLPTERDLLVDYISARSRVAVLRRMTDFAIGQCRDDGSGLKKFGYWPDQKIALSFMRQTESAAAHSRRLARDLKLVDP
ncbi:MAG: hypothetical protein ACTHNN_17225 [Xanthobacteraceae bacterium]